MVIEQNRYKTEPLKCWEEAKQLRVKYYEDYLKAKERGGIRVSGSGTMYFALLAGLGDDVYTLTGEPYAANISYHTDFSSQCMEASERAGIARDLCGYLRNYWGSLILDKYILADGTIVDSVPKTDFLFTSHMCCSHAKWYEYCSDLEGGIPLYGIDLCIHPICAELTENRLNYIVQQLMEAIPWMEKVTGRKYNDELLIEAINNECRAGALWGEVSLYQEAIPAPMDEKTMFSLYLFNTLCPERKEIVDFYERLTDEVKDRVERGIAAVAEERFRIITDSQPPWAFLKIWRYLEKKYGVISIGSIYAFGLQGYWDLDEAGNLVPAKTPEERGIKMRNREEALRAYAEYKLKNLCLCGFCRGFVFFFFLITPSGSRWIMGFRPRSFPHG